MLSVRGLLAVTFFFFAVSFVFKSENLEGRWSCRTKSGHAGPNVEYHLNCSGDIFFQKNGQLESSCSETLLPSGSKWRVERDSVLLSDSDGQTFVTYHWRMPDDRTLLLERRGVVYSFDRVFLPLPAGH
jgi:hypothetical protein